MISYSEREVFLPEYVSAWNFTHQAVSLLGDVGGGDEPVRCHELARAVWVLLENHGFSGWDVVDGRFGIVEHSWLIRPKRYVMLDPYSVGRLPMVQLLDVSPKFELPYQEGPERGDVRQSALDRLNDRFAHLSEVHDWKTVAARIVRRVESFAKEYGS